MYDELIKNLRLCSECDFGQNCNECTQERTDKFCCDELLHKAADAIEELSKRRDAACWGCKCSKIERNEWIPVTERLPEDGVFVLVSNDDGILMVAKHETDLLGWYKRYCPYDYDWWWENEDGRITHWMPLPEPPKDGEE